ncbi:growth-regulating factor 1-like isoform X2 [Henckelia pumila]|uniref:growth-regulating factor 1-like isoform X2 n=1 Tax=Henckelia pumila TaxID=405737 RepID=UPI003C6E03C0
MMSGGGSCRYPFTAIQWQELEHQALVFKYMASGIPVPPDLLFSIRRSLDSSFSSSFLLQQPQHTSIGWNGFQVGFGRKIDPEPGRCRRTDGKKWRCSKEAYPDSKYCERHMHRGRNRSRKPVEILSTPPKSAITPPNAIPIINSPTPRKAHSFTSPNLSSRRSSIGGLQENPTSFFMDSAACSPLHGKDYRSSNGHGLKREINEHTFFAEANPISNDDSTWQLAPLTIGSSLSHMKHKPYACDFQTGQHLQSLKDYNLDIPDSHHPKKIMHHFLDESPNKDNKDSWLNSDDKMSIHNKTHLSNSVPKSMHDFFMTQK